MPDAVVFEGQGIAIEALAWWRPEPEPAPAVVLLHGWGDRASGMTTPGEELQRAGFVAVALSMRGFGGSAGEDDCGGPGQVGDVVAVVDRLLGDERVAGRRVALLGLSQGGQVALLAAAAAGDRIGPVAAWKPVTDVARWRETTAYPGIPDYIDAVCADDLARRSPVAVAAAIVGPVLLVHGEADSRVPTEQSLRMQRALVEAGRPVELVLLPGVEHRMGPDGNRRAMDRTLAFLEANLR